MTLYNQLLIHINLLIIDYYKMFAVLRTYYAALCSLSVLSCSTLWKSTTPLYSAVGYM